MQPDITATRSIGRIARKEILLFFASPIAYLFLATFAAVTLFVFFWGEAFFSRNIADVRPLFEWMPVLLIFLCSTLTMRLWSEERRTGTIEYVISQPVPLWHFVAGKFAGCLLLLTVALLFTLLLPVSVALIADLDWGPVWAGYLATWLVGAFYLSIGIFLSARSDNQIVSLISAVGLCAIFYVLGTRTITDFFGQDIGEWLRLLGTGSRFDAITRGVIDLRDLYYFISVTAVFLALNTYVLERERWASSGAASGKNRNGWRGLTALIIVNALVANLWLGQLPWLRIDATHGNQYSISDATQSYLTQLQEPLLIRGYFSSKTHPLLSPLVPQIRDLIREYEIAGNGQVRSEFIDPISNPELEEEANQKYGIRPVPFQVADRYQSSIVSSYFDVLVQYGDEYQILGFRDLIEVNVGTGTDVDVQLRNPEHDLTRAIRKVLQSYQASGNLFDTVKGELQFTGYVSADEALPAQLLEFKHTLSGALEEVIRDSNGRLRSSFVDPRANDGAVAQQIATDLGFQPMATSLFSNEQFYFYLTLSKVNGDRGELIQIPLDDMTEASFERNLDAAIKRFASGFTKTLALVRPEPAAPPNQFNPASPVAGGPQFNQIENLLGADLSINDEDLSDGQVSGDADILMLLAPQALSEQQLFAVDQFLMQGGTVILSSSGFSAGLSRGLSEMQIHHSGMADWLAHHGLELDNNLVMDPQNAAFPLPVNRSVGGFQIQEIKMLDYPYFIDVRGEGLNQDNPITSDLPQATIAWGSPILVDAEKNTGREITELLRSSDRAWLSSSTSIVPRFDTNGNSQYYPQGQQSSHLLAVISAGRFDSFYQGKLSPLLTQTEQDPSTTAESEGDNDQHFEEESESDTIVSSVIERSPESARIILFASNDFLRDQVVGLAGSVNGSSYLNTLQLVSNSIDWSLEDASLLSIRSRGHFNRTLPPMEKSDQLFWEYLNYGALVLLLGLIALLQHQTQRARQKRHQQMLTSN